jgi:hypothetical protein
MDNFPNPADPVNPDPWPDVIVNLADGPAAEPAPPPPVATRCVRCKGPLTVWHGQPACDVCDFFTLPADDEWLDIDNGGHFE